MTWHPILTDADPADAWFAEPELDAFRKSEAIDRAIALRDQFEAAVADLTNPSPEEVRNLWAQLQENDQ